MLDAVIHPAGPVFGMDREDQGAIGGEVERTIVELGLGVEVVVQPSLLEPAQEAPLGRGKVAGLAALDRFVEPLVEVDVIEGLGAVEGERGVGRGVPGEELGIAVAPEVGPGIDGGRGREGVGVDVVTPAAEVVVGVPGEVARQDGQGRPGPCRRDDPGEREPKARGRPGPEAVEAAPIRGRDELLVRRARIEYLTAGRAVPALVAGLMASMVLGFGALGTLAGGWVLDRAVRRGGGSAGSRLLGGVAFLAASALIGLALRSGHPWLAALATALSCFAAQATLPLWWSCAIGISGRHVGALFGLMNSVGILGALSSQYLVGALADRMAALGYSGRAQWDPIFRFDMGILLGAGLLWATLRLVAVESPEPEDGPDAP
jgi:hypothetical protein